MFKSIQLSILTFLFTIICLKGFSQNNYQLTIGDSTEDFRTFGFIDQGNDFIIYGYRYLFLYSNLSESYVMRLDQQGNIINQKIFNVNLPDFSITPASIIPDASDGYIGFAFVSDSIDLGLICRKLRIMKLNHDFSIQYQKDYKMPYEHNWFANIFVQYDLDSTIICTMLIMDTSYSLSSHNTLIYRFNQQGDSLHANRITGYQNYPYSLLVNSQKPSKYSLFTWLFNQTIPSWGQIVHLDSMFNVLSVDSIPNKIYANPTTKWINNSKYITVGKGHRPNSSPPDKQISAMILNQKDSLITTKHFGKLDTADYPAWIQSLDFIDNNAIYFGGTTKYCVSCVYSSLPQVNQPFMLIKTDSLLNTQFEYYYDFNAYLNMWSIIATPDGGCIMLGSIYDWINAPDNNHDIFILKVDANGIFTNTKDAEKGKMSEAVIGPNPGGNIINVYIAQQIKEQVVFEMFDFTGKRVLQEIIQPTSTATINTSMLKSGMYFYRIKTSKKEIGSGKWIKVN